jgi:hypothetical protein
VRASFVLGQTIAEADRQAAGQMISLAAQTKRLPNNKCSLSFFRSCGGEIFGE